MVSCTACHQFAAQTGIVVDLQHVHADMRHAGSNGFGNGKLPAFGGLVGQSGDQINVDVFNSGGAQPRDILKHGGPLVQTPYRGGFDIHERLHPQAHAVHSTALQRLDHRRGQRAGRAFDRDFSIDFGPQTFAKW